MNEWANKIVDFYATRETSKKKPLTEYYDHFTNLNPGLGDTLSLTHLPLCGHINDKQIHIRSFSPHFEHLLQFNQYYQPCIEDRQFARAEMLQGYYDCGNGHFFQRLQRACGFKPLEKPRSFIYCPSEVNWNKIILHFSVGAHAHNQKHIHPRARELYPEHRETLQKFILNHVGQFEFIEIGTQFSELQGVTNKCGLALADTIREMAGGRFFIGLHSGVMHIAAALGLRSIIIINFPSAKELYLPALKDLSIPDLDWLYPQNVHLHEDEEGELVKQLTYDNLERALAGEIYPFWSRDYLNLIYEFSAQ